jgi:hypothetical protein
MIRAALVLVAGIAVTLAGAVGASSAPPPPNVTCDQVTQTFSGTAHDLTVPANGYCDIENATITHDLIVQHDSGGDLTNSTVGHDARYAVEAGGDLRGSAIGHDLSYEGGGGSIFGSTIGNDLTARYSEVHLAATQIGHNLIAYRPDSIQTGAISPDEAGLVQVENDFVIDGSPGQPDTGAFVFDGICDLSVGRDLRITNRWVTLGIGLGDECPSRGRGPVTVGRDLVFSGNDALNSDFAGPSALEVGNMNVGRNLTVTHNSAALWLEVADNTVAGDATCRDNNPAASLPESSDGPNSVGGKNDGCP